MPVDSRSGAAPARGSGVVTGAGRGLGRAIAHELARRGLAVHVTDVDEGSAREVAEEIGAGARASALDVCDREACRAAASAAPGLAVWVNNAGILPTGLAWEHDEAERRLAFEVNTMGLMNGTDAALELMRPAGSGHVINIVSLAGLVAAPGETLYSATKHAALAYTIGTLLDLRRSGTPDVHVSALCPDGIWTPMLQEKVHDPDAWPSWTGQMLQPEEVARAAGSLLDRPRPVLAIPRWRGGLCRVMAASPALFVRALPLFMRDARRKQQRYVAGKV